MKVLDIDNIMFLVCISSFAGNYTCGKRYEMIFNEEYFLPIQTVHSFWYLIDDKGVLNYHICNAIVIAFKMEITSVLR